MKKMILCLLVLALLATQIPMVFAAGSASVKGPDTVRAGDTITITFSAGGNIYGGSGKVTFDESKLTLQKYSKSLGSGWQVDFNGNRFTFDHDNGIDESIQITSNTAIFKATFTVNKNLEPGAEITVSVENIELSHGTTDTSVGAKTYKATIAPPLSDNCNLASLTVSNATISPAFSTGTTSYTASVPFTTDTLNVSATAEDGDAKVTVKNAKLTAGATTTVSITVKAANGDTKTYSIKVKRAQDPNYVASSNADLKELRAENFQISPAFAADVKQYYVWLPYEVDMLKLNAAAADKKAEVAIGEASALAAGKGNDILVTVTAEDGTENVYTVTAVRAPAPADTEAFLNPQPAEPPVAPTEPVTEPTEEPAAAPSEPVYVAPVDVQPDPMQTVFVVCVGALCLILGALLGVAIKHLIDKKNY